MASWRVVPGVRRSQLIQHADARGRYEPPTNRPTRLASAREDGEDFLISVAQNRDAGISTTLRGGAGISGTRRLGWRGLSNADRFEHVRLKTGRNGVKTIRCFVFKVTFRSPSASHTSGVCLKASRGGRREQRNSLRRQRGARCERRRYTVSLYRLNKWELRLLFWSLPPRAAPPRHGVKTGRGESCQPSCPWAIGGERERGCEELSPLLS